MERSVIVGYVRSPFQPARRGVLARVRPDDLAAQIVAALVDRTGVDPAAIEDVTLGCAFPEGEQGMNVGRIVGVLAGLPRSVGGSTVNRFCGSSMQAIHIAAGAIAMGAGEAFVCAGVESMTPGADGRLQSAAQPRARRELPARSTSPWARPPRTSPPRYGIRASAAGAVRAAEPAEGRRGHGRRPARRRDRADRRRHGDRGRLPAPGHHARGPGRARSRPSTPDGTVTAGTSSPLTDGAAAVLVCSEGFARDHGLEPLARGAGRSPSPAAPRRSWASARWPRRRKALERAGLDRRRHRRGRAQRGLRLAGAGLRATSSGIDPSRLNLDGGAIALGHPLGATGARITGKAAALLAPRGRALRARDPVHRRRSGHRHRAGGACDRRSAGSAVIGAGVMGAGIAAHVANAGVPVVLLDIVPSAAAARWPTAPSPSCKAEPALLMTAARPGWITTGNLEDDLGLLADADWIVEAVRRRRSTSSRRSTPGSSRCESPARSCQLNTSTIPLGQLADGAAGRLRRRLPDHPLLQSAALHAAARDRAPGRPLAPTRSTRCAAFADVAARQEPWCAARTRRLHRQPARRLLDRDGDR